jgi:hypothetical protein
LDVSKIIDYLLTQGPWAVACIGLVWVWLRTRKEAKESVDALVKELGVVRDALQHEKDARREEALVLQAKSGESLMQLAVLMEKVDDHLKRTEAVLVKCQSITATNAAKAGS